VLKRLSEVWVDKADKVLEQSFNVMQQLQESTATQGVNHDKHPFWAFG
jgi:hypothetical protein